MRRRDSCSPAVASHQPVLPPSHVWLALRSVGRSPQRVPRQSLPSPRRPTILNFGVRRNLLETQLESLANDGRLPTTVSSTILNEPHAGHCDATTAGNYLPLPSRRSCGWAALGRFVKIPRPPWMGNPHRHGRRGQLRFTAQCTPSCATPAADAERPVQSAKEPGSRRYRSSTVVLIPFAAGSLVVPSAHGSQTHRQWLDVTS